MLSLGDVKMSHLQSVILSVEYIHIRDANEIGRATFAWTVAVNGVKRDSFIVLLVAVLVVTRYDGCKQLFVTIS